jgi:hypothetical protein
MVLVVGGGAGGRHVQCGNDAVDKLDAGYIRDSGSEGRMERERVSGLDWEESIAGRRGWRVGWVWWWCGGVQRWRVKLKVR